jgi:hypothetical protein
MSRSFIVRRFPTDADCGAVPTRWSGGRATGVRLPETRQSFRFCRKSGAKAWYVRLLLDERTGAQHEEYLDYQCVCDPTKRIGAKKRARATSAALVSMQLSNAPSIHPRFRIRVSPRRSPRSRNWVIASDRCRFGRIDRNHAHSSTHSGMGGGCARPSPLFISETARGRSPAWSTFPTQFIQITHRLSKRNISGAAAAPPGLSYRFLIGENIRTQRPGSFVRLLCGTRRSLPPRLPRACRPPHHTNRTLPVRPPRQLRRTSRRR